MAKRSQRRPVRYEKDHLGCMWGLISMFDFRHGRTTQRLLSDRRRGTRPVVGAGNFKSKLEMLTYPAEDGQETLDAEKETAATRACKPSMKKLIEEEMSGDQGTKQETSNMEIEGENYDPEHKDHKSKSRKRTKKSRKKSCDSIDGAEHFGSEGPCSHKSQKSSGSLDIDNIVEEFCGQIHQKCVDGLKCEPPSEVNTQGNEQLPGFEEKLSEAIKFLISQKLINESLLAQDGELQTSKELMDALQILSSDEELFLKLLRDPNSLLVRYVQEIPDVSEKVEESRAAARSNITEQEIVDPRQSDDHVNRKQRNFFRRRAKSQERDPSNEKKISQASENIVILKPGPAGLQHTNTGDNLGTSTGSSCAIKEVNEKVGSHFFVSEIKRKLRHAIGKEQHRNTTDGVPKKSLFKHKNLGDTEGPKEYIGMNSPTKEHFFIERIAKPSSGLKKGEKATKLKATEIGTELEASELSVNKVSNIYIEAKKHLSSMLNKGAGDVNSSGRQTPKTLGRILSLPEYSSSPVSSPRCNCEHSFVTEHMLITSSNEFLKDNESKQHDHAGSPEQKMESPEIRLHTPHGITANEATQPCNPDVINEDPILKISIVNEENVYQNHVSDRDEMSSGGVNTAESNVPEEGNGLATCSELCNSSVSLHDQNVDQCEISHEKQPSNHSEQLQESSEENQQHFSPSSSPPNSSSTKKLDSLENVTEFLERPSPISVLDPLFTEDDISPASIRSHAGGTSIQPLKIQFEECESTSVSSENLIKTRVDDKEAIFEYIKLVLQTSGLKWDEICIKSLPSNQLLHWSLLDEVELLPNQLCSDQRLLFDCINEVLMEVFGCSPWVSFVKLNIWPMPNMTNIIQEVWKSVNWHLLPMPQPCTLDQIVRKDMAKTGTWMDLRLDADCIGVEMGEAILEDLVLDTIKSYIQTSPESENSVSPDEAEKHESSINL